MTDASSFGPVAAALREVAAGQGAGDLSIAYSDLHGLWGGIAVRVTGDGDWERVTRQRGGEPVTMRGRAGSDAVREIARLLLEIEAWEQRVLDAAPVPDESRATLTVRRGGAQSVIWERYNDLAEAGRIGRARDVLLDLSDPDHTMSSGDSHAQPLSAEAAVIRGHLVVTGPILLILLGGPLLGFLLFGILGLALGFPSFVVAWAWWSFTVPRWRRWARRRGADPDRTQRLGELTGLVWPKGFFLEKTEFPLKDDGR
jgi:hypothetical protein